mgnify:CR=1 FL=1
MSELPGDLRYTDEHEWLRQEEDGTVTVGITEHAQNALGDLVYAELPEIGQEVEAGGEMAVVESVKAVSDLIAPIGGQVLEVNQELEEHPERINEDPYGRGWILRMDPSTSPEAADLLSPEAYRELVEERSGS